MVVPHYTPDSPLVRAASLLTKPLPMEQFHVIQGFICKVPQGKKMVEEVSEGLGQDGGGLSVGGGLGMVALVTDVCVCVENLSPLPLLCLSHSLSSCSGPRWIELSLPVQNCMILRKRS